MPYWVAFSPHVPPLRRQPGIKFFVREVQAEERTKDPTERISITTEEPKQTAEEGPVRVVPVDPPSSLGVA